MTPALNFLYGADGCNTFYVQDDTCYSQNAPCTCDERLPEIVQRNLVLVDVCSNEVLAAGVAQQNCIAIDAASTQVVKGQTYSLSVNDCTYEVVVGEGIVPSTGASATASYTVNSVTGSGFVLANVLIGSFSLGTSATITPNTTAQAATLIAQEINSLAQSVMVGGSVSAKAVGDKVTVAVDANWYYSVQGASINGLSFTFDSTSEATFDGLPAPFSGGVYASSEANEKNVKAILANFSAQIEADDGCGRAVRIVQAPKDVCAGDQSCALLLEAYWPGEPFDVAVSFSPAGTENGNITANEVQASATNWDPAALTANYKRLYSMANDKDRIVLARMMVELPSLEAEGSNVRMVVEKRGALLCRLEDMRNRALENELDGCCEDDLCPPQSTRLTLYIEGIERALCNPQTACDVCEILEAAQAYREESVCHEC